MDIETFYDENEARRESAEFEFGSEWTDKDGHDYELSWVQATGELYLMAEPEARVTPLMFDGYLVATESPHDDTVVIIGRVATHEAVETLLAGWEDAITQENSLAWLRQRVPPVTF